MNLLDTGKGNQDHRTTLIQWLKDYPKQVLDSFASIQSTIAALQESIDNEETTPTVPTTPTAADVTITQPTIDAAVDQTMITIGTALEFRILSGSNAEKQVWTSGTGAAQKTSASPALVAGDKIEVRVKETNTTPASGIYTQNVVVGNMGQGNSN
ncbi:hypothetical protein [Cohnella sp. WQ 127256]|uniref:hypothetical protein n=1 Tax=Cohnella sp. WQ 127256 TaxID=2938790 RepID=UPI002118BF68|nr:hypothetical protein [Cohnella sp. WQ 127256]